MKLIDALDMVARYRPAWKGKVGWKPPFTYNRDHLLRLLGADKDVRRITKRDLLEMRHTLLEEPGQRGKRSEGGVNRIMSMCNTLLSDLVELEILDGFPKIKPLKENNTRTTFFTEGQINRMVKLAKEFFNNDELGEAILFAVYTGCRQGELLRLRVEDVDLDNRLLTFRDTKNGDDHVIDIHSGLDAVLQWRLALKKKEDKLFDFINDDQLRDQFYKVRDMAGIDDDHVWHSLRHTTATWLVDRDVPIQVIAEVLNHKTLQTTERYAKVSNKARKSAINKL